MKTIVSALWLICLCLVPPLQAQSGAVIRAAEELGEAVLRRGGTEAAEEFAKLGGKKAAQEIMEQAAREGGEVLVKQSAQLVERHGILALKAMQGAPGLVVRAVDGMAPDLAERGLRALVHDPVVMQKLVREFGSSALETAAKHPGMAARIGSGLGGEGLDMARRVSTPEAAILARHADDIARLPAAERAGVIALLKRSPGRVLAWMEKHPKLLIAGSATTAIVLARRELFGEGEAPGFFERIGGSVYETFKAPVNIAVAAVAGLVVLWAALRMRRLVRTARR